ncbi:hypothetical protein BDR04DRAFT_1159832 [Suillus decipiens]|nr:hypothetical protein BDR04DRAFT_1159832 [Suillus decipiens]
MNIYETSSRRFFHQLPSIICWAAAPPLPLPPSIIITKNDTMSDSSQRADSDTTSNFSQRAGPGASKGELLEILKMLQVQMQKLQEENRTIKEENKTLHAEKPKQKWHANAHDELSVHEETISIYDHKYGMMVEMFPSSDLLNKCLPDSPTSFDSTD